MFDSTFITLHRKIINSACFNDAELLKVWIWCLVRANHKDREIVHAGQVIKLKRGDFITGRFEAIKELKTTTMKFRGRIALLEQLGQITRKVTNKYTIISVVNYDYYQGKDKKVTNKQPTNNQQTTTDNNVNNENNISDESLLLENNQNNDMAWKKYNEDGHNDYTPSIDLDSGETITDEQTKQTEENKKITNNLKVLAEYRGLPFADIPTQRKKYHEVLKLGYSHVEIAEEYVKLIDSPYWKEQKATTKLLPDIKSLHSGLKNKTK